MLLDIFKVFNQVWHEGLIFKLKTYGVEGKLIMLSGNYLKNRKQRAVLHGHGSSWEKILAGVPQGSVLRTLFFLIYINNLPHDISPICKIFANDTLLFSKVKHLNYDLKTINQRAHQWKMLLILTQ